MNAKDLINLVRNGEDRRVEFKKKIDRVDKLLREIIAFANTDGGFLLIGVQDNKVISGVKDSIEVVTVLERAIGRRITPPISYSSEVIPVTRNCEVVAFRIQSTRKKPHFLKKENSRKDSTAYIRYQDKSIQASTELIRVIKMRKRMRNGYLLKYNEAVKSAVKMLDSHLTITLSEFQKFGGFSRTEASDTMIDLVLSDVVELIPGDHGDIYKLKR